MSLFISSNSSCHKVSQSNITYNVPTFFWLVFLWHIFLFTFNIITSRVGFKSTVVLFALCLIHKFFFLFFLLSCLLYYSGFVCFFNPPLLAYFVIYSYIILIVVTPNISRYASLTFYNLSSWLCHFPSNTRTLQQFIFSHSLEFL